jgi:endonuclease-3
MAAKLSKPVEQRAARVRAIGPILRRLYPDAHVTLDHSNPLELLVATILSAQCTDERVNQVTRSLFAKYRSAADYARVSQEELEKDIQSLGFYRNKAKAIRAMAAALVQRHGGQVPRTMEELVELDGVGRKTANVVLGNAFGKAEGIVVDTHVARLSQRLGLTRQTLPERIEEDLMRVVERATWTKWSHLLIHHGRAVCVARKPRCGQCALREECPYGRKNRG